MLKRDWGRVTHKCVSKRTNIGSDNGLSHSQRQTIICTNVGILLFGLFGTNFSEISIKIHTFLLKKMLLKLSSGKWRLFCLGLNFFFNHFAPTATTCPILHSTQSLEALNPSTYTTSKKYVISFKDRRNTHTWHFDLLKMQWHQLPTNIVTVMLP